jgi:prepilin-type N-terminal cleavage/methylation domain-containing protein
MRSLPVSAGFTLVEILLVVLLLGIFAGTGVGYYTKLTQETHMNTFRESLGAFFAACRERARLRGFEVICRVQPRGLFMEGVASPFCPLPQCSSATTSLLDSLRFYPSQTLARGLPVERLTLEVTIGGKPSSVTLELPR